MAYIRITIQTVENGYILDTVANFGDGDGSAAYVYRQADEALKGLGTVSREFFKTLTGGAKVDSQASPE